MKPLGGEQVVAAPLHHQHSTTTFISVLFGSGYSSSDQLWGQICVCLSLCVCFLMLMLKFTKCTTWRCHFTSCHLAVALPVSSSTLPLYFSPTLSLSQRLVSSLRLFFIFILAFVFIDSQVVWLFHFSFGRKTFDLPPLLPLPHSHTRIRTLPAHILSLSLAPSACHSHSFSRLLSVIGYQWLTRLSFSALYVYVMTIRIDILLRSAKFTQLLSQLPLPLPHHTPLLYPPYFTAVIVDCI